MADITARLVWFKLGEAWASADILDVIFLGWCIFGLAIVLLAAVLPDQGCSLNSLPAVALGWVAWARAFYSRMIVGSTATSKDGPVANEVETCGWLNTLVTWYFLNRSSGGGDDFVNAWLAALNQAMSRRDGPKERAIVFQEILVGSLPPKILHATATHCYDTHNLAISLKIHAEEIRLKILLPNRPQKSSCEVTLTDVSCRVLSELRLCQSGFSGSLRLVELPEACAAVAGVRSSVAGSEDWIAREVVAAIGAAVTEISSANPDLPDAAANVSSEANQTQTGEVPPSPPPPPTPPPRPPPPMFAVAQPPLISPVVSPIDYDLLSSVQRPLALTAQNYSNGSSSSGGRRLLVKVVKAGGLAGPSGLVARASVELDNPRQRHETGGVFGSTNPYWDQHFVFSLSPESSSLSIQVLHQRDGGDAEALLGSASLPLSLVPPTGARVLQPLRPPGRWLPPAGQPLPSITLELLFMDDKMASRHERQENINRTPIVAAEDASNSSSAASSSGVVSSSGSGSSSPVIALGPVAPPPQPLESALRAPVLEVTPADAAASSLRSSSLSRVVDEFMTSPDISYQMSSFSESTLNGAESRALSSTELDNQVFDSGNTKPVYNEFSSLGRKPKGQKPSRTGSVASRIKRVFSGRNAKRNSSAAEFSADSLADPVLSAPNALRVGDGPSRVNGDGYQMASVRPPTDLGKSKSRGISSSFRRLFSGRRKQRQTSETADSELNRQSSGQTAAPTFYSLQKPGKSTRMRPWDSDEVL